MSSLLQIPPSSFLAKIRITLAKLLVLSESNVILMLFQLINLFQLKARILALKHCLLYFSACFLLFSLCAVHSKNAELFHLIEECLPKPDSKLIDQILSESIKCHHNDIANYIMDNFYINQNKYRKSLAAYCLRFYNFSILPDDFIDDEFLFFYMCEFDYFTIVDFLLKTEKININSTVTLREDENKNKSIIFC